MEFPTASIDVAQAKLSRSPAWKTTCEASVQIMGNGPLEQHFHPAHRLAWEKDFDDQGGHNSPSRKRKYDEASGMDNTSHCSGQANFGAIQVSRVGSGDGDAGSFVHGSGLATSSVTASVYTERISEHRFNPASSSSTFHALEYDPNEEHNSDSESDSDEESDPADELCDDSDEELYEDDFEYEPANSHPPWTREMSPSLNPSRHSTPPEVLKWVYWPPIYDSLDQIRHNFGARYHLIKTVCIKAAMAEINFVDLSAYRFPYGAMGRLRPLPRPPVLPRLPVILRRAGNCTPSPLRQVEKCDYPEDTRDKHHG